MSVKEIQKADIKVDGNGNTIVTNENKKVNWSKKKIATISLSSLLGLSGVTAVSYGGIEMGQLKSKVETLEDLNKDILMTQYNEIKMYISLLKGGVDTKAIIRMFEERLQTIKGKLSKLGIILDGR